jgi:transcriptional regulator with XRE-family HTH domain
MKLKEWIEKSQLTQREFALALGLAQRNYINRIINQRKIPSRSLADQIEKITHGEVSALELLYPERFK